MSAAHEQLLEATIRHLEDLQAQGVRYVAVAPETLRALARPAARPAPPAARTTPLYQTAPAPARPVPARPLTPVAPPVAAPPAPAAAPPAVRRVAPGDKVAGLAALRERTLACVKCPHLASSRQNVVFGVGDPNARLMFVGEAPGADEDRRGEPFVGAAGQLLTKIIQATGLTRESVYIANILKCRPDTPGQTSGNRKPTPEEMATCLPYLQEQIDLIQPELLVALGATAVEGLLGKTVGITRLRGHWQTWRGIPVMPTYHPSYLLHRQDLGEKRKVWEDMLQVMEKLALPISEKQRQYFLKG
jgi:DNA polymerase